jgi:GT2 family glycosyltransferase
MNNIKVIAIVVTYNRLELLKESINALLLEQNNLHKILVVNNASTDGTAQYLNNLVKDNGLIKVLNLDKNIGSSGGQFEGIKEAIKQGATHVWLMDDDTIVQKDALKYLIEKNNSLKDNYSYLASSVYWTDGSDCLMNKPIIDTEHKYFLKKTDEGLLPIKASSFVSMFIPTNNIKQIGLPLKEFFIWGDDIEYSSRLSAYKSAFLCISSCVIHKTAMNVGVDINKIDKSRSKFLYFDARNSVYIILYSKLPIKNKLSRLFNIIKNIFKAIKHLKFYNLHIYLKGLIRGLFFKPKVENV